MLDAKSAFDVVRHANLIRKLYHYGVSKQCILMIDNLYRNATTKIKWKGEFSERLCNFDFCAACPMNSEAKV
jgi:hypothetical protein